MVRPVGAAISRPPVASPEWFGPSALSRKVGGRLIAAPTVFPSGLGPYGMVRLVPSSVTGFARATFPVGEGFLRRGTKPSSGRGWQGEALTGVGRYEPGLGTAPLPAPGGRTVHPGLLWPSGCFPSSVTGFARATFPVGEGFLRRGDKTLSWERVARRSRDGCGAVRTWTRYSPSSGPGGHLPPGEGWRDFLRKTSKFMLTFWVFNGKIPEPHQEGLRVLPKSSRLESETTH